MISVKTIQQIRKLIKESKSVLLHLHPSPDGDSVGSALAMFWYLKGLDKKVTIIKGDSEFPSYLNILPGSDQITSKNYFEVNIEEFDLFISLDSSSLDQISKKGEVKFPATLKTIVIDHHATNTGYGNINLLDTTSPATSQIIFDIFQKLKIHLMPKIAINLFIGIYTDTGGFKYSQTSYQTLKAAAKLAKIYPDFPSVIFEIENNNEPEQIIFKGLALNSVKLFFNKMLAVSVVGNSKLKKHRIYRQHTEKADIPNILKSVKGWMIGASLVEREPGVCGLNLRTRDSIKYDVSKIASATGFGGGHPAAAGATIKLPINKALKFLLKIIKSLHPELGEP